MATEKKVDITPHISIIPKLGHSGYRVEEAISELIENAVDARIDDKEPVTIEVTLNNDFVRVSDNASGMDEETAVNAMRLAHSTKKGKLGEFGLGLKTACMSLGKSFSIDTTKAGSSERFILEFNEEDWLAKGNWNEQTLKIEKTTKGSHGTTITIRDLLFDYYPNLVTKYKDSFSMRFGSFIANNEVRIKVNTKFCKPYEFDLTEEGKTHFDLETEDGHEIVGWYGLLKTRSTKGYYGFNLFKNERLIEQFQQIGFPLHPENARIVGEIHLNHVPTSHNKREFLKESRAYKLAEKKIVELVKEKNLKAKSREYGKKSKKLKIDKKIEERLFNLSSLGSVHLSGTEDEEIPQLIVDIIDSDWRSNNKVCSMEYNGNTYRYVWHLEKLKEAGIWTHREIKDDIVHVFINEDTLLFDELELPACSLISVAEGIAEAITKKENLPLERVLNIRDNILKELNAKLLKEREEERKKEEIQKLKRKLKKLEEEIEY